MVATRRGFWVGMALPMVGLGIAAVLWWVGEGGLDRSQDAVESNPSLEVRARAVEGPQTATHAAPAPSEAASVSPSAPSPAAEAVDRAGAGGTASSRLTVTVQVGSYRTRSKAERVLAEVRDRTGLSGLILDSEVDGVPWHRILLGAFPSAEAALAAVRSLDGTHEILIRPLPDRWASALAGGAEGDSQGGTP